MLGKTAASAAASTLDAPRAIASQNRTRCSRRPAGGCPPDRVPAAAARSKAGLLLGIATPQRQALRRPLESTPSSPGHTGHDPQHPADTPPRTAPDPSAPPPPTPTTPDAPPAATPSTTAASTTTDRDHNQRSSEPCRKCLKRTRQHRYSDSLATEHLLRPDGSDGECPRICVGMSELEPHAFDNYREREVP